MDARPAVSARPRSLTAVLALVCLAALAAAVLRPADAAAEVDCPFAAADNWSGSDPPVNQDHIYCGEWSNNRPKGFHSRPEGENPATVGAGRDVSAPNANGIYEMEWSHAGHAGTWKGSTMFPDSCTQAQVLNSIVYAANHVQACVPAVPWGLCGLNRPDPVPADADYCLGDDAGTRWQIRFATIRVGGQTRVNTAFPNR